METSHGLEFQAACDEIEEYLFSSREYLKVGKRDHHLHFTAYGGTIHFIHFETRFMPQFITFLKRKGFHANISRIAVTGGGAYKFAPLFEEQLGISIRKYDELDCLIRGLHFIMNNVRDECFTWKNVSFDAHGAPSKHPPPKKQHHHNNDDDDENNNDDDNAPYPFLLVNIGSGVSIIKVFDKFNFERVSGTSLGGGTYWGLCRLLTKYQTFDESMEFGASGKNKNVDMLVGDIYGGEDYSKFGLSKNTIASSLAKINEQSFDEDIAKSVLIMITQNIGQVSYLNAKKHNVTTIFFCGNFLRQQNQNEMASQQLAHAIHYWSNGEIEAQFFKHEGYFGAIGAFVERYDTNSLE